MFQAICLEPLNFLFYTWPFLRTLEKDEKVPFLKRAYQIFAGLTIFVMPLGFYGVFLAYVVEQGKFNEYSVKGVG